jgi:orotate phosphoribosyltransferase
VLAGPRRGHFDLGTGYHGDLWLDLDAMLLRPAQLDPHIRALADWLRPFQADAICGPLAGGAYLAWALANRMATAFLPAERDYSRPAGQPPAYRLPAVPGGIAGWRVAIADDAVNAGTAVRSCFGQLSGCGAIPVAVVALLALTPASTTAAEALAVPFHAAETVASQAWPARQCPLCARGTPLSERPAGGDAPPAGMTADEPARS